MQAIADDRWLYDAAEKLALYAKQPIQHHRDSRRKEIATVEQAEDYTLPRGLNTMCLEMKLL